MRFIELAGPETYPPALIDPDMVESIYPDMSSPKVKRTIIHMVSGHRFWVDMTQEEILDLLYPPQTPWVPAEGTDVVQAPYPQVGVPCTHCGAKIGFLCTAGGGLATYPHKPRQEAWHDLR